LVSNFQLYLLNRVLKEKNNLRFIFWPLIYFRCCFMQNLSFGFIVYWMAWLMPMENSNTLHILYMLFLKQQHSWNVFLLLFCIFCFRGGSRNKNCKFIHTYAHSKNNKVTNVLGYIQFVYFSYVFFLLYMYMLLCIIYMLFIIAIF